jgi:thiol-disulfide isomerase/thioredoxin
MKTIILIVMCIAGLCHSTIAQKNTTKAYPSIGEVVPDHTFTDLANFPQPKVSLKDFRGKWLVIDFWAYSCGGCIASFPNMDTLAQEFKDKAQVIMVGLTEAGNKVERDTKYNKTVYQRKKAKYGLKVTFAFDSLIFRKFDVGGIPQIYVIDPNGIIRAKTLHLGKDDLTALMEGRKPVLLRSFSRSEPRPKIYNDSLPLLTTGKMANGGNDTSYLYRSVLVLHKFAQTAMPQVTSHLVRLFDSSYQNIQHGKLEFFGEHLDALYLAAFFGANNWTVWDDDLYPSKAFNLILEMKDKEAFKALQKTRYAYSLSVPVERASPEFMMKAMRLDLEKYFGYKAVKEVRDMPVYYMEVADRAKVEKLFSAKPGKSSLDGNINGRMMRNMPMAEAYQYLTAPMHLDIPVLNNIGIDRAIDMDFKADMMDSSSIIKNLENFGLKLVKGTKKMEVIVLRDDPDLLQENNNMAKK